MWPDIAARIISATGSSSTVATVSNSSACFGDSLIVIALTGFIGEVCHQKIMVVNNQYIMVSWYHIQKGDYPMAENENGKGKDNKDKFQIQIDRVQFTVTQEMLTGAQLRQLPSPPIGP